MPWKSAFGSGGGRRTETGHHPRKRFAIWLKCQSVETKGEGRAAFPHERVLLPGVMNAFRLNRMVP